MAQGGGPLAILGAGADFAAAGFSIGQGFINAAITREYGKMQQSRLEFNSKMSALAAQDVLATADEASQEYMKQVGQVIGQQKASYAAGNVNVNTGVARRAEQVTRATAQQDVLRIKNNAWNQAFGLKTQSIDQLLASRNVRRESDFAATQTILTGIQRGTRGIIAAGQGLEEAGFGVGAGALGGFFGA